MDKLIICNNPIEIGSFLIKFSTHGLDNMRLIMGTIAEVIDPILKLHNCKELNQAQKYRLVATQQSWHITLFWTSVDQMQKISKEYSMESIKQKLINLPFNTRNQIYTGEYAGRLFSAQLELCMACMKFANKITYPVPLPYDNALDWWKYGILHERSNIAFNRALEEGKTSKNELHKEFRHHLRLLNEQKNPYDPTAEPELHNLIQIALTIIQPNPRDNNEVRRERKEFRLGAWRIYKQALARLASQIKTDRHLKNINTENGAVYSSRRREKGKRADERIWPPIEKSKKKIEDSNPCHVRIVTLSLQNRG